jgi:hypothetical protein
MRIVQGIKKKLLKNFQIVLKLLILTNVKNNLVIFNCSHKLIIEFLSLKQMRCLMSTQDILEFSIIV